MPGNQIFTNKNNLQLKAKLIFISLAAKKDTHQLTVNRETSAKRVVDDSEEIK